MTNRDKNYKRMNEKQKKEWNKVRTGARNDEMLKTPVRKSWAMTHMPYSNLPMPTREEKKDEGI